ncbi:hypothetical protein PFISCL1PPCAC_4478 [Pristionchus fissidentatus]|uniref:F-box domain-containing protein n=1 Tax=Pristionchus fissidentatus TaxID=1538716 RepID=A0AAV5V1J0_9BILA|nr:hypothetical protein PFISCL1PPCAC_4478 [Pristionchus fissidentatus]
MPSSALVKNTKEVMQEESTEPITETLLLDLPNEMLARVFSSLTLEDRKSFRSVNDRLKRIERNCGGRHFTDIGVEWNTSYKIIVAGDADMGFIFNKNNMDIDSMREMFKGGYTEELEITGDITAEAENLLPIAFNTLKFGRLSINMFRPNSGRLISRLLDGKELKNAAIELRFRSGFGKFVKEVKQMLREIPHFDIFRLSSGKEQSGSEQEELIDDDVLLHLVKHTTSSYIDVEATSITSRGLYDAFKLFWVNGVDKEASFNVPRETIDHFCNHFVDERFTALREMFRHKDSEATFSWSETRVAGEIQMCFVFMRSRKVKRCYQAPLATRPSTVKRRSV